MEFQNVNVKGVNYPKTQLGRAKMDTICHVATELFAKQNFYETSIGDICKAAKTAVGTFYIYFADKSALYNYLVFNYKIDIISTINGAIAKANCQTRKEKEREGIKAFIKYVWREPQTYAIIWGSLSVDPLSFNDYYTSFARSYENGLAHDKAELKNDVDLSVLAYVLMGITNFLGLKTLLEKDRSNDHLEKIMDDVIKILENGVLK